MHFPYLVFVQNAFSLEITINSFLHYEILHLEYFPKLHKYNEILQREVFLCETLHT